MKELEKEQELEGTGRNRRMREEGRGTDGRKKGTSWKYKCSHFVKQRLWNEDLNEKEKEEEEELRKKY
jgi:hypothetical protein